MIRIGISGGTFDPIHHGHLILAEEIRDSFQLDKIIFIPSGMPPHKKTVGVTDAEHRYGMVKAAVSSNPNFELSSIEIDRKGFSYTIDTLNQLKNIFGKESRLFFITGADVVWELPTWRNYQEIFKLCEFIVALRPGYDRKLFIKEVESLKRENEAIIHIADALLIDISSTAIRERIRTGRTIKYLVPEGVEKYIYENNLYR